ncbi:MAG: sirohydrochlorin cobaltochelatase [Clostridiales bacterium]|jgi:iron complex transport system substrate-binding protein|nr:sirohydrochlorin cobaltochelatase [Clostridiales bacterium]
MKQTKLTALFLAVLLAAYLFAGCAENSAGANSGENAQTTAEEAAPQVGETAGGYEEGTSSTDGIVNTTSAEKVLLVVSFGTSFNQSRDLAIGGIETAMKTAFPDYQVRRAFTAQIIIDKLAEREKLNIDNIEQAMDRLVLDRVKEVVIQPTTVMSGYEYDDVIAAVTKYAGKFESLKIGKPLLTSETDYNAVADIVSAELAPFEADDTTVLLMGHGTHHEANATYPKFEETLKNKGHDDILVGTVEGGVLIEDLQALLKEKGTKKVVLRPLMIVAGDHANNDMAGGEEDSWKTILLNDGYGVETAIEGLGQLKGIQDIFIQHVKDAIASDSIAMSSETAAANAAAVSVIPQDGIYTIEAETDSSMFKIIECTIKVDGGKMSADITLSGQGFSQLYCGTGEQALADGDKSHFYLFTVNGERHSFTIPVEALDTQLNLSGFSARREKWYDHTVIFNSATLTAEGQSGEELQPQTTAWQTAEASQRQINVTLTGGTGRSGINSPAPLFDKNGKDYARITWSSPNYTYMVIGGEKYLPVNAEGNSVFEIPVTTDTEIPVTACTVAMSAPKEIEYTLKFTSARNMELKYATQFSVNSTEDGCTLITIAGGDTFLLVPEGQEVPQNTASDITVLRKPVENIYLAATSAMCLFDSLNALNSIAMSGTKADGWYIENAREAMENGSIVYAGKYNAPDYELIMAQNCGLAVESTMISHAPEVKEKLEEIGVPVLVERSSYEPHPLGRTEWIKLYGLLTGKEELAAKIFDEQAEYLNGINTENTGQSAAFFYISSAGGAVARKPNDYITKMIELAGGKYVFTGLEEGSSATGSVNLSMETFYEQAKDADCIIYNSSVDGEVKTIDELLAKSHLLADFKAVKNGNVWCSRKNLFQETTQAGQIISDMHRIFTGDFNDSEEMNFLYKLR